MHKEGNGKIVCMRIIFSLITVFKMDIIFTKTKNKQKIPTKSKQNLETI